MKLYLLIGGWHYEGLDNPIGVFSTREGAEAAKVTAYKGYSFIQIDEYTLNEIKS